MASDDELDRLAEDYGLGKAAADFRPALEKALSASRKLKEEMPRDFGLADEPAHVLRLVRRTAP